MSSPTDADGDDDFSMMMISCTANYMNCTKSTKEIAWLGVVHGILSSYWERRTYLLLLPSSEEGGRTKGIIEFRLKKDPHYSRETKVSAGVNGS